MDYQDKSNKILWHKTTLHRLRFISFVSEQFWKLAFKRHKGLNCLTPGSVKKVYLSDITINGQKQNVDVDFIVTPQDAALSHKIAVAVVIALEDLGYRIYDAIVPGTTIDGECGEHDILAERRDLPLPSSVEVKCRTIKNPKSLLPDARKQLRKDATKLFDPKIFSERLVVLVEFGEGRLEAGWRILRIEKLAETGWKPLRGWQGASAASVARHTSSGLAVASNAVADVAVASGGLKRKRESTANSSNRNSNSNSNRSSSSSSSSSNGSSNASASWADSKWVLVDGVKYTTLPWFLGKAPLKSQRTLAALRAFRRRLDLKQGDWKTLTPHWGKEILAESALNGFRAHRWVNSLCSRAERFSKEKLQVRLLSPGQQPTSNVFLWCVLELEKCYSLRSA
jgi:hypothetical protein